MGWGKLIVIAVILIIILSGNTSEFYKEAVKYSKIIYDRAQYFINHKEPPSFDVSVKVSDLPKAQDRYFVLVVTNAGKSNLKPDDIRILANTLSVPILVALNPNDVDAEYLSSLVSLEKLYDVDFAIWVPTKVASSGYDNIANYVEKNIDLISQYVDVNTLVTDVQTLPEDFKKYAVANSFYVVKAGNGNNVEPIEVAGKETTQYSFSMLYYNKIDDPDVALVKSNVQDLIENHKGILIVGFNADMIHDTADHQDVNLQNAIINPLLQLENAYSFVNMKFNAFLDFYQNVVGVRLALKNKENVEVDKSNYGTKTVIRIPKLKAFVTLEVPDEIGLVQVQELSTVSVTSTSGSIPNNSIITIDRNGYKYIYLLNDYDNVVITLTYVKKSD